MYVNPLSPVDAYLPSVRLLHVGSAYEHFSASLAVPYLHPDYISASPGHSLDKRTSAKLRSRLQSFSLCEQMLEDETG